MIHKKSRILLRDLVHMAKVLLKIDGLAFLESVIQGELSTVQVGGLRLAGRGV